MAQSQANSWLLTQLFSSASLSPPRVQHPDEIMICMSGAGLTLVLCFFQPPNHKRQAGIDVYKELCGRNVTSHRWPVIISEVSWMKKPKEEVIVVGGLPCLDVHRKRTPHPWHIRTLCFVPTLVCPERRSTRMEDVILFALSSATTMTNQNCRAVPREPMQKG